MPRRLLLKNEWRPTVALLSLLIFFSFAIIHAGGAQGGESARRHPALSPEQMSAAPLFLQETKKRLASVRSVDTAEGSRVTVVSDVAVNDYSAYLSSNRFYVVIPEADASRLQNTLRGQGFDDVKIQKRDGDVVLSFRLGIGVKARVEQKFNRLDIIFTMTIRPTTGNTSTNRNTSGSGESPGQTISRVTGSGMSPPNTNTSTASTSGTGGTETYGTSTGRRRTRGNRSGRSSSSDSNSSDVETSTGTSGATGASGSTNSNGSTGTTGSIAGTTPTTSNTTSSPTTSTNTDTTAGTSSLASPSATPAGQLAQAQQPVTQQPPTVADPVVTDTGFAAAVRSNWLPLLIGALVLITLALVLLTRSRARRELPPPPPPVMTARKEVVKETPKTKPAVSAATSAATAAALAQESATKAAPAAKPVAKADAASPLTKAEPLAKETKPAVAETKPAVAETKPVVAGAPVDRASVEVKHLLAGEKFDEAVVSTSQAATRQVVATELLGALSGRDAERRDRARAAYVKHGYFDEATRALRTAQAPAERASAAHSLGLVQDRSATPHLVAALEDKDPEVRRAAITALAEVRDPEAIGPLNKLLDREKSRKVPLTLVRRAIEASATVGTEQPVAKATATASPTTEQASALVGESAKAKDDEDREVFEI
jgi:hypothetical protein